MVIMSKGNIDLLKELDVKLANRRKSDKSYLHWEWKFKRKEMKLFVTTSSPPPTRKQEGDQGEIPNVVFATDNNYYSMIVAIV